jgi:hypothetical protein
VTNTLQHQHPFYPFKGEYNSYTANTIFDAYDYRDGNNIFNFIKSNFARTAFLKAHTEPLEYKFPLMVSRYEIERYAFAGVMVGGFGVWYSAVIVISFLIIGWYLARRLELVPLADKLTLLLVLAAIFSSILINPLGYIARYIPQYYIIPFIAGYIASKYLKNRWIFHLLCSIMIINSLLICGYSYYNFVATAQAKRQLVALKTETLPIKVNFGNHLGRRASFDDNGIKYIEVTAFPVGGVPDTLFRSEVTYIIGK